MGVYLNPGNDGFKMALNSKIYVDKSGLISYTNSVLKTEQRFVCVSRPRRFGKSMAANMLTAYYEKDIDSSEMFQGLSISQDEMFKKHLNKYNVVFLNIQTFLSRTHDIMKLRSMIEKSLLRDLMKVYPDIDYLDQSDLISSLMIIYGKKRLGTRFIFIIDGMGLLFSVKIGMMQRDRRFILTLYAIS